MGLLDFKKPEWQSKDAEKRLAAVQSLDPQMTAELLTVAQKDQEKEIRLAAISRLSNIESLESLSGGDLDQDLSSAVTSRLNKLYCGKILNSDHPEQCLEILSRIEATEIIAKIAVKAGSAIVRFAAVEKIDDQNILSDIVRKKCGREPALAALEKIDDEQLLAELSEQAASKAARRKAEDKLAEIEARNFKPDPMIQKEEKLSDLLAAAKNLVHAKDWDKATERLVALRNEWQKLDSTKEHHLSGEFEEACRVFEEQYQEICERRREEQEKAAKFQEQQSQLEAICTTIEALVSSVADDADQRFEEAVSEWEKSTNKESFKAVLTEALKTRYSKCYRSYLKSQEKIRVEKGNSSIIEDLFHDAEKLLAHAKMRPAKNALEEADQKLKQTTFKLINVSKIRKRHKELQTLLDQKLAEELTKNITSRTIICEKLETLLASGKQSKAERKLKNIRQEWHNLPDIDSDQARELGQRFADLLDKFTDKQKSFYHDREWQSWANLNVKEKLLERAEGLDNEEDLATVLEKIKELQKEWKSTGPLPRNVAQQLWERFHAACDRNYERCAPYREQLKQQKKDADQRREEICVQAEELASSTEWRKTAEELKALQTEWKSLLHNKRHEEEKQYRRFRKACNTFFDNRHKNYEGQEEKRHENLSKKEKLCEEAEQLAAEPDLASTEKFGALQTRWKKIGQVPRKKEKAIWGRFRTACDQFFSWLDEQRLDNLKQKEALCIKVEALMDSFTEDSDRKEIAAELAVLQEQWKEIGQVPADQTDAIWKRFHEPCDQFFKAQREHFKAIEAKRLEIQELKEDFLQQAEEFGTRGIDKETTALMKELQKKWHKAGRASREAEKELNQRFDDICNSFFEGRRQHFKDLHQERLDNLKSRETLCLRLEHILGVASKSVADRRDKALTLAEELKLAMEENFMLAGRNDEKRAVDEEVKKIQQEWKKVGPVPRENDKSTIQRFKKALNSYYDRKK